MQRNFLVPVLLAGALLSACVQPEPSTPAVGVLDTARVFRDSALGKAGVKYLQDVQTELQAELDAAQKQLQEKPNDEALQAKVQEIFMNAQQRHNAENQQVITLVNDALLRTVNAYRVQKKLLLVVGSEAALSYDASVDVTADVIAALDKEKVEFKPVRAPEPTLPEDTGGKPAAEQPKAPENTAPKDATPGNTTSGGKPATEHPKAPASAPAAK